MKEQNTPFCKHLLKWHDRHGRHDLPWCQKRTGYRVWISEIMLQQTQVSTVIEYFHRFMKTFPTIKSLALASENEVFDQWSGLGYYRRARFCHQTAKIIHQQYRGRFPRTYEQLIELPGIGKSTACAILSLAFDAPHAILDGNVKRVLSRFHGIEDELQQPNTLKRLWHLAEAHMPAQRCSQYTQAIMDLGATICKKQPLCNQCPQQKNCLAHQHQLTDRIPNKKRLVKVKQCTMHLLMIKHQNDTFLIQRSQDGIWAQLWCFPELPETVSLEDWCHKHCGRHNYTIETGPSIQHQLTHRLLHLNISLITLKKPRKQLPSLPGVWYKKGRFVGGLPKPIAELIK